MKSSIVFAAMASFLGAASAVDLVCYGTGVPSPIRKGDIEFAIKNRPTELGIPGGTKFTYRFKTCIDPENSPKEVAVITTPSTLLLHQRALQNCPAIPSRSPYWFIHRVKVANNYNLVTREGSVKLANGVIECSTDGPPDSTC